MPSSVIKIIKVYRLVITRVIEPHAIQKILPKTLSDIETFATETTVEIA
jgi:hypothetical protein